MATRRLSLPSPQYHPPEAINESTTNYDVRGFVYEIICRGDEGLDQRAAWELACKVIGDGRAVLRYEKAKWNHFLGDWGDIVYEELASKKYVHTDTIWPYLTYAQSLLLVVAVCTAALDLNKGNELRYTKGCGIAFLVYTIIFNILHTIASTRWFEHSNLPTFLKHRPAKPK